jgi:hypothetical protein
MEAVMNFSIDEHRSVDARISDIEVSCTHCGAALTVSTDHRHTADLSVAEFQRSHQCRPARKSKKEINK